MASKNKLDLKETFAGYGKMLRHDLRYNWILGMISFITFFCLLPVRLILMLDNRSIMYYDNLLNDFFDPNSMVVFFITILLAFLFSVVMFKYIHGKKSINFYHSLPVKREAHFLAALAVSIIYFTAAFFVCLLLSMVIFPSYMTAEIVALAVKQFLLNTFYFVMLSAFFSVSAVLCGTVWSHAILAAISLGIVPLIYVLTVFFAFLGQNSLYMTPLYADAIIGWQSPAIMYFSYFYEAGEMGAGKFILCLAVMLLLAVIFAAIALLIYKKLRSENAGKPIIFKKFSIVLQYILTYAIMLCAGYIIYEITSYSMFAAVIAFVAVGFVAFGIINMIFLRNRKKFFAGFKRVWIMIAVIAVVFPLCYADIFGFDEMLPKSENVESLEIYYRGENVRIDGKEDVLFLMDSMDVSQSHVNTGGIVVTDITDINEKNVEYTTIRCRASMKLENGITITKYVFLPVSVEPSDDGFLAIISGRDALETTVKYLAENKDKLSLIGAGASTRFESYLGLDDYDWIDCLEADLASVSEDYYKQEAVASITCYVRSGVLNSDTKSYTIYVTEEMKNTVGYLKQYAPYIDASWEEKAEYFEYCNIMINAGEEPVLKVTDKALIADFLENSSLDDLGRNSYNSFYADDAYSFSSEYYFVFYFSTSFEGRYGVRTNGHYYKGSLPSDIISKIESAIEDLETEAEEGTKWLEIID